MRLSKRSSLEQPFQNLTTPSARLRVQLVQLTTYPLTHLTANNNFEKIQSTIYMATNLQNSRRQDPPNSRRQDPPNGRHPNPSNSRRRFLGLAATALAAAAFRTPAPGAPDSN